MILEARGVTLSYPRMLAVVKKAAFTLSEGETLTILGPNGAGKSTLLNALMGLHLPDSGEILLCGESVNRMKPKKIARQAAYVRQYQSPVFAFTVHDFVMMGRAPKMSLYARPGEADEAAVSRAMAIMDIEALADRPYTDISGGQRQQAVIARALAQEPRVVLLDEPTAHLDFGNQIRIIQLVQMLSTLGYAVVMTTHDPNQAILLGGKTAVLGRDGELHVGKAGEILQEELLCRLYDTRLKLTYVNQVDRKAVLAMKPVKQQWEIKAC